MRSIYRSISWLVGGLTASVFLAMPMSQAATVPTAVQQLLPQGTTLGSAQAFTNDSHHYELITTVGNAGANPWIVVGEETSTNQWTPVFASQTRFAYRESATLIGPTSQNTRAITVEFIVDAATALMSNIDTLLVSPSGIRMVEVLPDVVGAQKLQPTVNGFEVNALNLQVREGFEHGRWSTSFTPTQKLLSTAVSHPVWFVMGSVSQNATTSESAINVLGPSTIQLKVGQSLAFVPANANALDSLWGDAEHLGYSGGIGIYAAEGHQSIVLDQVSEVFNNHETFSSPGVYHFAIVPPNYRSLAPNQQVGLLTVDVSK